MKGSFRNLERIDVQSMSRIYLMQEMGKGVSAFGMLRFYELADEVNPK